MEPDDGREQQDSRREYYRLGRGLMSLSSRQLRHVYFKEQFITHIPHMWGLLWLALMTMVLSSSFAPMNNPSEEPTLIVWAFVIGFIAAVLFIAYLFRNGNGNHHK